MINTEISPFILDPEQSPQGRVAERTSSRLRRTNDRSVLRVISSDAEHARQVSYASKRKYKLDLSSLHEDHEDDENAEIGVSLHAPQVALTSAALKEGLCCWRFY
ncbi:MAG: hypothetical protein ACOYK1_03505 [Vampirovibrionia bacterium]